MKNKFVELHLISEAHKVFGYDKPKHPLISLLDFTKIKPEVVESDAFYQMSFYTISCKRFEGVFKYGKSYYDFNEGTLMFTSPHQVVSASHDSEMQEGWGLFFHPDMTFCYISGVGTDSTEKGRTMWARVKGKTENDLMKLPFKQVFNFRPAGIEPFLPLKPSQTYYKMYKYSGWLFSLTKVIAPNYVVALKDIAAAMINVSLVGYYNHILEVKDIEILAKAR